MGLGQAPGSGVRGPKGSLGSRGPGSWVPGYRGVGREGTWTGLGWGGRGGNPNAACGVPKLGTTKGRFAPLKSRFAP